MLHHMVVFFFAVVSILCFTPSAGLADDCGLRIITELSHPSTIQDDGRLSGFGVEVVEALKKEIGCGATIEVMPWARGYRHLLNHSDVMLFSTARTKERENQFYWIGPIACYKWVFYGLKGVRDKVKTLEDAKNVSGIGVYRNDARAQFLKGKGFTNLEVMDSQEANFKKLLRGRVELVATSNIGVPGFLSKDLELRKSAVPILTFHSVKLYLAISKSTDKEKVLRWQKAFKTLMDRGTIRKIQEKWIESCPE
ncbi:substrate-binding periplasmic protein [Maridesulfovibrio salexigens]|uniref:Extracellular solute-binding protein family 3 n=1 Tax=Maridesulfovibrio salexigens (strain ATCC 14822 / DSM 2638 / NCIMB 8403 / VKM B-1763) TaxID=526222 RepID=C6BYA2_MARSD|nr:ABC transporter substrate-binding protein [Maridesulfovibrio salexigens]ACS78693.1 extracellular solute-binding protein family 3 [Maridesulfovibrio salexigens DSM 2638]